MKRNDIDIFEKLNAQLSSFYQEISTLAKKSPNDAINKFKLQFVNETIEKCNELIGEHYRPFADFKSFSLDEMPTNSDVTFILSQYIECAEKFRSDNVYNYGREWFWNIDDIDPNDTEERIGTALPKKLTRK